MYGEASKLITSSGWSILQSGVKWKRSSRLMTASENDQGYIEHATANIFVDIGNFSLDCIELFLESQKISRRYELDTFLQYFNEFDGISAIHPPNGRGVERVEETQAGEAVYRGAAHHKTASRSGAAELPESTGVF